MALLEIIQPDNPLLRKPANRVRDFGGALQSLIEDMYATMMAAEGIGLAGPQVAQNLRIILVRLPDDEAPRGDDGAQAGRLYVIANPKIIKHSRHRVSDVEGCLSLPGLLGDVERYESIVITGQDRRGQPIRIAAEGLLARAFQHEIDHLDGTLFIDIATAVWHPVDDAPAALEKTQSV